MEELNGQAGKRPAWADAAAEPSAGVAGRPRTATAGLAALSFAALLFTAHVSVHLNAGMPSRFWDHWVSDGVIGGAAIACLLRARAGSDRAAWALIGVALVTYWLGDLYWNNALSGVAEPPYPSWADAGWLLYYLPLYAGMMLLIRSRIEGLASSTWLEGLVGALALGAVAATVVFDPVVASTHGSVSTVLTNLAYPTFDVLLLAFVAGALGVLGRRAGPAWTLLGLGLLVAGVADSAYLFQAASGTYSENGLVNAGWPVAFTLIAVAAWSNRDFEIEGRDLAGSEASTLGPLGGLFALLVLGLLVYGTFQPVPTVAHVLLTLAVLVLFGRVALATRERELLRRRTIEARTDDLTGILNGRAANELLDELLAAGRSCSIAFLDIDRFLDLIDTLGRAACDELIRQATVRLTRAVPEHAALARVGDDEFLAVLPASDDPEDVLALAARMLSVLEEPFPVDGLLLTLHASLGVAIAPLHATARKDLLRCADIAMCRARAHHAGIELYEQEGDDYGSDHLRLVSELRRAIDSDELALRYQPKVAVDDGTLLGAEVLVRWQHPRLGLLAPGSFISIVEREGLMRMLTLTVLEGALSQQAEWRKAGIHMPLAVNLSPSNLLDSRLPEEIGALMSRHGTSPGELELEITEETLLRDTRRALEMMARLAELGVEFSLDDFGTGYSSLEQLRRLPVQALKIDHSFVMKMDREPQDEQVVTSVIQLARGLGLRVIAEGVESETHLLRLRELGCDVAQGFHISRPIGAEELVRWRREHQASVALSADVPGPPVTGPIERHRSIGFAGRTF